MTAPTPATPPSLQLVLIRHAESLRNREGEKVSIDTGLTELGWRQAHAVAEWLATRYRPDALYASDLIRSRQTAEVISNRLKLPVLVDEGLAEADFEYWDELPYRWERPMDVWTDVWQPNPDISPLYSSFRVRLRDALTRILDGRTKGTVVAVTHGGAIGTLLRSLFGGHHVAVLTANTGVTQLSWEVNHWRLDFHNSAAHLEALTAPRQIAPVTQPSAPWTNGQNAAAIIKHYQRVAAARSGVALGERELRELVRLANPQRAGTGPGRRHRHRRSRARVRPGRGVGHRHRSFAGDARNRRDGPFAERGIGNVHFTLGQIGVVPLPERSFDIVAAHDLLQYVADLPALFALFRAPAARRRPRRHRRAGRQRRSGQACHA